MQKVIKIFWGFISILRGNPIFAYFLLFALFMLFVFGYLSSCREKREEKKDQENKIEIPKEKGRIEIIEEQRNAQIQNNNISRKESENANANFNAVINVDSSQRDGNFSAVKRKWCADHPNDSRCK